jgi:hypothetical protein
MVRVTIESQTNQDIIDWAVRYLQDTGYSVTRSQPKPETPEQLGRRLERSRRHVLRRLAHPACPDVEVVRSRARRVSLIVSNPQFEAFLKQKLRN